MLPFSSKFVHVYLSVREILSLLTMKTFIIIATVCKIYQGRYCLAEYSFRCYQYHYFFSTNVS